MSKKVDFICVGAKKAATTWLHENWRIHPDISVPHIKETNYFNLKYKKKNKNYYHGLFKKGKFLAEACPNYTLNYKTLKRIYQYNTDIKIIFIIREPTERAVSQYRMEFGKTNVRRTFHKYNFRFTTKTTLKDMFDKNIDLIKFRGLYSKQLEFLEIFPDKNKLILTFDEINKDPVSFYEKIFDFMDVKPSKIIKEKIHKYSPVKESNKKMLNVAQKAPLKKEHVEEVKKFYEEEIRKLAKMGIYFG